MKYRVLRGGSFINVNRYLLSSYRIWIYPANRHRNDGFRIVIGRSNE